MTITSPFLSVITIGAFVIYLALDVSTHLTKETSIETIRRVLAISVVFGGFASLLSFLYSQILDLVPSFSGPVLTFVWMLSLGLVLGGAWRLYHRGLGHSKLGEKVKQDAVDHSFERLDGSLKPLTDAVATARVSITELSRKVDDLLGKGMGGLVSMTETQTKTIGALTQTVKSMNEKVELREAVSSEMVRDYNRWYEKRGSDNEAMRRLISGTQSLVEKLGVVCEQLDGYLDGLAERDREPPVEQQSSVDKKDGGQEPIGVQLAQSSAVESEGGKTPPTTGKLTKEAGIANRERGNKAQLQFSETVLRGAGKRHDYSLREGEPDFTFLDFQTNAPKAVGAFKALTLLESGTRQRWIPRRKLVAETRTSTRLGVPLILFVQNLTNGRIWAKVISAEEAKNFKGLTTPLMLIDSDARSEKTCRETLDMALKLL